jgi:hypothetical protein
MKGVVPISNLTAMSEPIMALTSDFYLLLAQYIELREKNNKLKKQFEINQLQPDNPALTKEME